MNGSGDEQPASIPVLTQLRLAAGFLTIIPVLGARPSTPADVAASFRWFPLVGFVLGAIVAGEDWMMRLLVGRALSAAIVVMTLAVITGALHLDGLADTADALGAGSDRERALAIMRDSQIGSFGAIALFFVLGLKLLALTSACGGRMLALYLAPGLGRYAMVAIAERLDYLRDEGAGAALLGAPGARGLTAASVIVVVAMLPVLGHRALRAVVTAVVVSILLRICYRRWLGGVTGDMLGAAGELVETAVLIAVTR
jgi:adenosylcobinamide-GDP ribazoletransferase